MFKSILSVIVGYVVMVVITMILFGGLAVLSPDAFGSDGMQSPGAGTLVVILAGGLVSALAAGWVTARTAPRAHFKHVLALTALVVVMWGVSLAMPEGESAPGWYQAGLGVVGVAGVLLGGRLRVVRASAPS